MSCRTRSAFVSAVLIAVMALTAVAATNHGHNSLAVDRDHLRLPSFAADHDHPVGVPHIEDATRIDASDCIGCLVRQRQQAASSEDPGLVGVEPQTGSPETVRPSLGASDSFRLLPSRAPPSA